MRITCGVAIAVLCLLMCSGCGSGDYEKKLAASVNTHAEQKKFGVLQAIPTEIAGAKDEPSIGISYQPPRAFLNNDVLQLDAADPRFAGQKISPDRVFPPFPSKLRGDELKFTLPGFKLTYEGYVKTGDVDLPYYFYVAAVLVGNKGGTTTELRNRVTATFPTAEGWKDVTVTSKQTGKPMIWKVLHLEEKQTFQHISGDPEKSIPEKHFGIFELWVHETEKYRVIFGWRWPKEIEGKTPVGDWAKLTAATLVENAP